MYLVTGGAGFIGSAFVAKLNKEGIDDIIIADALGKDEKWKNLRNLKFLDYIHKDKLLSELSKGHFARSITAIVHMGACSSTTEQDCDYLMENNFRYSKALAEYALNNSIRFVYASSAATYGNGEKGYNDNESEIEHLTPLNPYGYSKQFFDLWLLREGFQKNVAGIKFFNVYGPNEYHKGDLRSMVLKAWQQIRTTGKVKLYKSYRTEYKDGEQKRDFIYIKDCLEPLWWLTQHDEVNGIFNLGTGKARSWLDLANAAFKACSLPPNIEFIEMPIEIKNHYQYFTEAQMGKLQETGCPFTPKTLEESIKDYIQNHLEGCDKYLSSTSV